jgi:hypothetical protein
MLKLLSLLGLVLFCVAIEVGYRSFEHFDFWEHRPERWAKVLRFVIGLTLAVGPLILVLWLDSKATY